jgi:hypothetical protein
MLASAQLAAQLATLQHVIFFLSLECRAAI